MTKIKLTNSLMSTTAILSITLSLFLIILILQPISAYTHNNTLISTLTPTIISKNTKSIAFTLPNLPYDINISEEAQKKELQPRDLLRFDKTKYYGDADIRLMQKINVTKQKKESYECNCTKKLVNNTINRTCKICYKYKNYTIEVLKEIDPKNYTLSKDKLIYEVFEGCKKIEKLDNEKFGCSIWTDINILGQKLKGLTWWNSSWSYRQTINISNTAGDLTNYQVRIDLNSTNVGANFDWSDNSSIRFTDSSDNLLDYWIESWNSTADTSTIWVNVTSLTNNANTTIYMYYGNPSASSASNGENTFEFFDDFEAGSLDTNKWIKYKDTFDVVENPDGSGFVFRAYNVGEGKPNLTLARGKVFDYKLRTNTNDDVGVFGVASDWWATTPCFEVDPGYPTTGNWGWYDGSYHDSGTSFSATTWYSIEYIYDTSQITFKVDGANVIDQSNTGSHSIFDIRASSTKTLWIDNFRVRKYASPEPTVSIGSEETKHIKPNLNIRNIYPPNDSIIYEPNIYHTYNVTWDNSTQTNCSLYLNKIENTTQTSITQGLHNITPINYTHSIYNWYINCTAISSDNTTETKQSKTLLTGYANQTGTNENYLNPFNQTTQPNRLILYPIRQIVYS